MSACKNTVVNFPIELTRDTLYLVPRIEKPITRLSANWGLISNELSRIQIFQTKRDHVRVIEIVIGRYNLSLIKIRAYQGTTVFRTIMSLPARSLCWIKVHL